MQDIVLSRCKRLDPELVAMCNRITEERKNNPDQIDSEHSDKETNGSLSKRRRRSRSESEHSMAEDNNEEVMEVDNTNNQGVPSKETNEEEPAKKADSPLLPETPARELKRVASSGKLKSTESVVVGNPKSPIMNNTNGHANGSSNLQSQFSPNVIFDENEATRLQRNIIKNTARCSLENLMEIRAKVYQRIFAHSASNDKRTLLSVCASYNPANMCRKLKR